MMISIAQALHERSVPLLAGMQHSHASTTRAQYFEILRVYQNNFIQTWFLSGSAASFNLAPRREGERGKRFRARPQDSKPVASFAIY